MKNLFLTVIIGLLNHSAFAVEESEYYQNMQDILTESENWLSYFEGKSPNYILSANDREGIQELKEILHPDFSNQFDNYDPQLLDKTRSRFAQVFVKTTHNTSDAIGFLDEAITASCSIELIKGLLKICIIIELASVPPEVKTISDGRHPRYSENNFLDFSIIL